MRMRPWLGDPDRPALRSGSAVWSRGELDGAALQGAKVLDQGVLDQVGVHTGAMTYVCALLNTSGSDCATYASLCGGYFSSTSSNGCPFCNLCCAKRNE